MKWFVLIVILLLIGCSSHRVDSESKSFVDREGYVRPDALPAPAPPANLTNATGTPKP